jgi:tRNA pseudouridine13 synthase
LEKLIGIEVYDTKSLGIGGVIRQNVEDFVVEELLVDGSKAEIVPRRKSGRSALGSSSVPNRYLLCTMVKRDWDTLAAIKTVSDQLGVSARCVQIAGIKDAKAVTAQHITLEGVTYRDVDKIRVKGVTVHPVGYVRSRLSSYYLLGNSFHIAINAIKHPKLTIKRRITKTMKELEAMGGIPNFFGHQRFGTTRPITHLVGKAILEQNFRKAAMLFLAKPSHHEHPASREARQQLLSRRDFKEASKNFPKQLRYERLMLNYLALSPEDFVGAFNRLPTKLQELFPQAYQSFLFNRFLSKRIASGLSLNLAEVGDYVVNVQRTGLPMRTMYKMTSRDILTRISKEIRAGKMRLAIPLVGFKQRLSEGRQGEIEREVLREEGIQPDSFNIAAMPHISLRGELRTATTPPVDFSLEEISDDSGDSSDHRVRVSFTLYRSSYATVLLRELMKPGDPIEAGF